MLCEQTPSGRLVEILEPRHEDPPHEPVRLGMGARLLCTVNVVAVVAWAACSTLLLCAFAPVYLLLGLIESGSTTDFALAAHRLRHLWLAVPWFWRMARTGLYTERPEEALPW